MTQNKLAQPFTFIKIMTFTIPTMIMMIFMSLYQTIDGVFVSNLIGELALTALNIVYPYTSILIAIAIMLSTGSSAIIALNMGQKKHREAKENFSFIVLFSIVLSLLITMISYACIDPILSLLGTTNRIYGYCYDYLKIMILSTPFCVLQLLFQTFFVTAGKPKHGLILTILAGIFNMIFDYVFIVPCQMGIKGAAIATSLGYAIVAVYGLYYFSIHRKGTLYFIKPSFHFPMLKQACMNGMSEMINNLAIAITTYLFNIIGIHYLQEEGVAAITIVLYAQFIMTSIFMGYASGIAPVFSYKYGANDQQQIHKVFKVSILFTIIVSIATFLLSFIVARPLSMIFASHNTYVLELSIKGLYLFSISFLFTGLNIFASSLFTAFSNGKISGILSFLRTFVFLVIALLILPLFLHETGIWLAVPLAEGLALVFSIYAIIKNKDYYHFY